MSRLQIDSARCSGHGRCYELAPSLITDDEAGYGQVLPVDVDDSNVDLAQSAVRVCPERAISLLASDEAPAVPVALVDGRER